MDLLITAKEVMELAFDESESLREDLVKDPVISMAQIKFIEPVLGPLYKVIHEPAYENFVNGFIKPPLAFYVRSLVVDNLTVSLGNLGAMQYSADKMKTASDTQSARIRKKAKYDADTLLDKAVAHIEDNPEDFPSYDNKHNIRHRISIQGGIIL